MWFQNEFEAYNFTELSPIFVKVRGAIHGLHEVVSHVITP